MTSKQIQTRERIEIDAGELEAMIDDLADSASQMCGCMPPQDAAEERERIERSRALLKNIIKRAELPKVATVVYGKEPPE